jgi:hypothetical protein
MDDYVSKPYHFNEIYEVLERQLKLKFVYRVDQVAQEAPLEQLSVEHFAGVEPALREELRSALESLDPERIADAVKAITEVDAGLGKRLSQMVAGFRYPAILRILDSETTENH